MNKKLSAEQIGILLNINGKIVQLEQAEPGYFNGDFRVGLGFLRL